MSVNTETSAEKKGYKYRILEYLNKLPHQEYKLAKKVLPRALKVSHKTFNDWLYIKADHGRMIPAESLIQLADYFNKHPNEMFTYPPTNVNYNQIKEDYIKDQSQKNKFA